MNDEREPRRDHRWPRVGGACAARGRAALLAVVISGCTAPGPPPTPLHPAGSSPPAEVGCRAPGREAVGALDVAIAIDTSRSTADASGADVNGNGRVGELVASRSSDPADSLLAAQIAAVEALLRAAAGLDVRLAIVSFAGSYQPTPGHKLKHIVHDSEAVIRSDLTDDIEALQRTLRQMLAREGNGYTNFTAGMKRSVQTLSAGPAPPRSARKRVFFISDSATPIVIGGDENLRRLDPRMKEAAYAAIRSGISFDTFAIGSASESEPPHVLSRIAGATGGTFHAVPDPADLSCRLIASLAP